MEEPENSAYGHFLRSDTFEKSFLRKFAGYSPAILNFFTRILKEF